MRAPIVSCWLSWPILASKSSEVPICISPKTVSLWGPWASTVEGRLWAMSQPSCIRPGELFSVPLFGGLESYFLTSRELVSVPRLGGPFRTTKILFEDVGVKCWSQLAFEGFNCWPFRHLFGLHFFFSDILVHLPCTRLFLCKKCEKCVLRNTIKGIFEGCVLS